MKGTKEIRDEIAKAMLVPMSVIQNCSQQEAKKLKELLHFIHTIQLRRSISEKEKAAVRQAIGMINIIKERYEQ